VLALAAAGCNELCDGPACAAAADPCPPAPGAHLRLEHRWSISTDEDANPEIVSFVPGTPGRAIVTSTKANRLSEIEADEDSLRFVRSVQIETGDTTSGLTSVSVSPSGELAAITVTDYDDPVCTPGDDSPCEGGTCVDGRCACHPGADPSGCGCGAVMFADLRPGHLGEPLGRVGIGYAPDGGAFSPDGRYFITADEDDLDERPCKGNRRGGSVSIIELGAPDAAACETPLLDLGAAGQACRVQQIPVVDEPGDEPEDIAISRLGAVVVSIQDSDKLGFFSLDAIPGATLEILSLGEAQSSEVVGPDGLAISPDGRRVAVSLEDADSYLVVDLETHALLDLHAIGDDVPSDYHRDERQARRQLEPEQVAFVRLQGADFLVGTLQETGAAISYRLEADGQLTFDSIQPVGFDWAAEQHSAGEGQIRPEGISVIGDFGSGGRALVLTANEREGSVTLLRSSCPR
jgi:DNA-binding beta-propeller fold protein YncE